MTGKIGRSLTYVVTLFLGVLLGFLFAKSGNAPKLSSEYRSLAQSSGAPLLSSSPNAGASKRRFGDVADQSVNSNLSVPISALKDMGLDGIDVSDDFLRIDDTLSGILGITDVEVAELREHFSSFSQGFVTPKSVLLKSSRMTRMGKV